jgi:uncharacterized repeat protein (TIGR01451 family)
VVTDVLPSNISGGYAIPMQSGGVISAGQVITWERPVVPGDGGADWVRLVVTVSSPLNNGTLLTNTAGIRCEGAGATASSVTTTVTAAPNLKITQSAPAWAQANTPLTYTIRYTNTGNGNASGVVVTDTLPSNVSGGYAIPMPASGAILAGQVITWSRPDVPGLGGTGSVTLIVTPARSLVTGTMLLNTAGITCSEGVSASAGPVTTTVVHGPATTVALSPVSRVVTAGESITYTVTAADTAGNVWDATNAAAFGISSGADGSWAGNVYTSRVAGTWTVTATVDGVPGTATLVVNPTAPLHVELTAAPAWQTVGHSSALTATVTDLLGNPVANGTPVVFETDRGHVESPRTTTNGVATSTISATQAGAAYVSAACGGLAASTVVTFTPDVPYTVTVSASPQVITPTRPSTVAALVTDQYNNAVADGTPITFTWTLGVLSPGTTGTVGGQALATFTSTIEGTAIITATTVSGAWDTVAITVKSDMFYVYLPLVIRQR